MKLKITNLLDLWILLIILLFLINQVDAQHKNLRFEHLSIGDGLSNSTVNCILKDSRGLMWFGTNDGLNKYDGYQFTIYKNAPDDRQSINSYEVMAIMENRQGNIWIATKRGGLDIYDRETDRITNVVPKMDNHRIVESMYVFSILEDDTNKIWFGTASGLYKLDRNTNAFTKYLSDTTHAQSLSNNRIHCLFEDSKNRLWIGTSDGLNLYDQETNAFKRFIYNPPSETSMDIRGIYEDAESNLWLSVYFGGLIKFDINNNTIKHYLYDKEKPGSISTNQLFCIAGDRKDNLYIGTENGGLNIFNIPTEQFDQYVLDINDENSINSNSIYSA